VQVLRELRSRGDGVREAGGFLIGRRDASGARRITGLIPYDEVDPLALRGIIVFDGSKMDRVWARCAELGVEVVADLHTHPGGYGQSRTDQANPMLPERGHMALIVPNFADRDYGPGQIGIYEFLGRGAWRDHSAAGRRAFRLEAW
jgi:proteasome lid subunit RPN8/RPN11